MKKTNYKALKVANIFINIVIAVIVISTIIAIGLSVTQSHLALTNQVGNGIVFDINIPEKLLHSPAFIGLTVIVSVLWIALLVWVKMFFQNIIDNRIFTQDNVKLARYVGYNFIALAFLDSWFQSLCSGSEVLNLVNVAYLLAAFVVWVFSMILKEANIIAEENEFTI